MCASVFFFFFFQAKCLERRGEYGDRRRHSSVNSRKEHSGKPEPQLLLCLLMEVLERRSQIFDNCVLKANLLGGISGGSFMKLRCFEEKKKKCQILTRHRFWRVVPLCMKPLMVPGRETLFS